MNLALDGSALVANEMGPAGVVAAFGSARSAGTIVALGRLHFGRDSRAARHDVQPNFHASSGESTSPAATANTTNATRNRCRSSRDICSTIRVTSLRRRADTVRTTARPAGVTVGLISRRLYARGDPVDEPLRDQPVAQAGRRRRMYPERLGEVRDVLLTARDEQHQCAVLHERHVGLDRRDRSHRHAHQGTAHG